jgi:hypothetical protein
MAVVNINSDKKFTSAHSKRILVQVFNIDNILLIRPC